MNLLRKLILEYIIDVEEKDDDGKTLLKTTLKLNDDEYDDYKFYINKLRHSKWVRRSDIKKSKTKTNPYQDNISRVIEKCSSDPDVQEKLRLLVDDWHEDMYLILLYMSNMTIPGKNEFPFLQTKLSLGNTYSFPALPSKKSVNFAYNTTSRVGRANVGKGEMLIALMTGGLPVREGVLGDLKIGNELWEVKDTTTGSSVRLGEPVSAFIINKLIVNNVIGSAREMKSRTALLGSGQQKLIDAFNQEIVNALNGLTGFVEINNGSIITHPIKDVTYESQSNGRVNVKFKKSNSSVSADQNTEL